MDDDEAWVDDEDAVREVMRTDLSADAVARSVSVGDHWTSKMPFSWI